MQLWLSRLRDLLESGQAFSTSSTTNDQEADRAPFFRFFSFSARMDARVDVQMPGAFARFEVCKGSANGGSAFCS